MATDCEQLSPNARKIFQGLVPRFGEEGFDPWGNPLWTSEGKIRDNWLYDLRKHADRQKMIERYTHRLGSMVEVGARIHRKQHGSLEGFDREHFPPTMFKSLEILHLLHALDFQIETMDLVEGS